jgi:hypothetical protein
MQSSIPKVLAVAATAMIAFGSVKALAADPPSNVRGKVVRVDGDTIDIRKRDGSSAAVHLTNDAKIVLVAEASLSDVKPGSFIGTTASPHTNGTLQASEIHIFPESMRGAGQGDRAWDTAPKSTMTNGTVAQKGNSKAPQKVENVAGDTVTVNYGSGDKVVTVTPATKVVALVPGDRSELKPEAEIFIPAATTKADGALEASRITVGKNGLTPPM